MATPFIGEIRMFGFQFAPRGWATCDGQILSIAQNTALFSILGTTYGGNGVTTFALPDLKGRVPNHMGQGPGLQSYVLGQRGGEENHTLILSELPMHNHTVSASSLAPNKGSAAGNFWAQNPKSYAPTPTVGMQMAPGAIGNSGGGLPHPNVAPYLVVSFCIALQGVFPSRN